MSYIFLHFVLITELNTHQISYTHLIAQTCSDALKLPGCCRSTSQSHCYVPGGNCYCDSYCVTMGDCCDDVPLQCHGGFVLNQLLFITILCVIFIKMHPVCRFKHYLNDILGSTPSTQKNLYKSAETQSHLDQDLLVYQINRDSNHLCMYINFPHIRHYMPSNIIWNVHQLTLNIITIRWHWLPVHRGCTPMLGSSGEEQEDVQLLVHLLNTTMTTTISNIAL